MAYVLPERLFPGWTRIACDADIFEGCVFVHIEVAMHDSPDKGIAASSAYFSYSLKRLEDGLILKKGIWEIWSPANGMRRLPLNPYFSKPLPLP